MTAPVDRQIAELGPTVRVSVAGAGTFLFPRYYGARHLFTGAQVRVLFPALGSAGCLVFPELPAITCSQCGLTSWNPEDVERRFCGSCHVFYAV